MLFHRTHSNTHAANATRCLLVGFSRHDYARRRTHRREYFWRRPSLATNQQHVGWSCMADCRREKDSHGRKGQHKAHDDRGCSVREAIACQPITALPLQPIWCESNSREARAAVPGVKRFHRFRARRQRPSRRRCRLFHHYRARRNDRHAAAAGNTARAGRATTAATADLSTAAQGSSASSNVAGSSVITSSPRPATVRSPSSPWASRCDPTGPFAAAIFVATRNSLRSARRWRWFPRYPRSRLASPAGKRDLRPR